MVKVGADPQHVYGFSKSEDLKSPGGFAAPKRNLSNDLMSHYVFTRSGVVRKRGKKIECALIMPWPPRAFP